ncbi:MAG: hypothetical protein IPP91_20310 [Betaproteobacteria bacterium]|nr:hypothetical protein [Betaproteobacteria bacterium]
MPPAIGYGHRHIAAMVSKAKRGGVRAIAAINPAGLRMASNAADVVAAIEARTGVRVEVISGEEEGRWPASRGANRPRVQQRLSRRVRYRRRLDLADHVRKRRARERSNSQRECRGDPLRVSSGSARPYRPT